MNSITVLFYIFSAVLLLSAFCVITAKSTVHAALYLVLGFFNAACLWMLLEAEFLAISLVLVYVGAVMVLFLFVVMMLDINIAKMREGFWRYLPLGGAVALLLVVEMSMILISRSGGFGDMAPPPDLPAGYSNTKELGLLIYTEYVYPFEIAAVILLVAIVAAIALTLRKRKLSKYIDPAAQIGIRRKDRVRIVTMASEERQDGKEGGNEGKSA
jgi:NADH-quinone oxidoreductase subunit J